jgi:hypothetical protein
MPNSVQAEIEYFFNEGKDNLEECLRISFDTALRRNVKTLVIFTGVGEGPKLAVTKFRSQECYADIKIIAVTFPHGKFKGNAKMEISPEDRSFLSENDIPIIRAHLPFNPIDAHQKGHGILGQDLTLVGNVLSIFCGSMSLCVQAALMACDAGEVGLGEHIIALTSDTAILVRTAPTERLLTDFIVREILCKPMSLTIIKSEAGIAAPKAAITLEGTLETPQLLPPGEEGEPK